MARPGRKGSVTVLLVIMIASIVSFTVMFCNYSRAKANECYAEACVQLACRSMLSEYDIRLFEDYGIMAYRGNGRYVQETLTYYLNKMKRGSDNCFRLENITAKADTSSYNLKDLKVFEEQVVLAETYNIGNTRNSLANSLLVNMYIMSQFKYHMSDNKSGNQTRLRYEVEYILEGKSTDSANLKAVEDEIVALRTPVNEIKIYNDPVRSARAMAEAEILTPGPEAVLTQAVIITAWAVEDSKQEAKKVMSGGSVDGMNYKDFLNAFLLLRSKNTKLTRMQRIIENNMKLTYYPGFCIEEHCTGFRAQVEINGRMHTYEHSYT